MIEAEFSKAISTGRMILILGDLAGRSVHGDAQVPLSVGQLVAELGAALSLPDGAVRGLAVSEGVAYARGKRIEVDATIASRLAIKSKPEPALGRLLRGPFARIYDLAGLDIEPSAQAGGFIPAAFDVRFSEDSQSPPTTEPTYISLVRSKREDPRFDFDVPTDTQSARAAWFQQLQADVLLRPCLIVASEPHDELWRFLEVRRDIVAKARSTAFFVSDLDSDLISLRANALNIHRFEVNIAEMVGRHLGSGRHDVLEGRRALARSSANVSDSVGVRSIDSLVEGTPTWDFLRGSDPQWADVHAGRLANRSLVDDLSYQIEASPPERRPFVVVRGRAGSGKTAALMAAAHHARTAKNLEVYWLDRSANRTAGQILDAIAKIEPDVIVADNIDQFGERTASVLDGMRRSGRTAVLCSVRTTRDWAMPSTVGATVVDADKALTDQELQALVKKLSSAGYLGHLKAVRPNAARVERLGELCERDLLAALIEVHYGVPFEDRILSEVADLDPIPRDVYQLICFTQARVFTAPVVSQEHVLQILARRLDMRAVLRAVDKLVGNGLVTRTGNDLKPRHRAIADVVVNGHARDKPSVAAMVGALLEFYARRANGIHSTGHIDRRRLVALLSHTLMVDLNLSPDQVREIYAAVQGDLDEDRHFWLQRGAFEVERGDIDLADRFLEAARASEGGSTDFKVTTEWGLMRLKCATRSPGSADLQSRALVALDELVSVTRREGRNSPHTFAVIVRDGVLWLESGPNLATSARSGVIDIIEECKRLGMTVCSDNTQFVDIARKNTERISKLKDGGSTPKQTFPMI
jgi:hypothetical protein